MSDHNGRVQVLGTGISITNMAHTLATLENWVAAGSKHYVCVTPVHAVMESLYDPRLREILNASGLTVPDGMPLVWAGKIYGKNQMGRVYGPDLMLEACRISVKRKFTHFLYGGNVGVAQQLKANLEKRFPGIAIVGTFTPPFRPLNAQERDDLRHQVADCRPDFFSAFEKMIELGTKPETKIKIVTPIINLSKAEIVKKGIELDAPLHLTWSCYQNEDEACGVCDSCALRLRGFQQAGFEDTIKYKIRPRYL